MVREILQNAKIKKVIYHPTEVKFSQQWKEFYQELYNEKTKRIGPTSIRMENGVINTGSNGMSEIIKDEIRDALKGMQNGKAPEDDKIMPVAIKTWGSVPPREETI